MKVIKLIARLLFIACVWSIGYLYWFQQLMIKLWSFNPLAARHWRYIWTVWQRGWVIRRPSEWLFVILLFSFIPLWFIGWALLSSVSWSALLKTVFLFPLRLIKKKNTDKNHGKKIKVTRKKSYKKIRPPAIRPASGKIKTAEKTPEQSAPAPAAPAPTPATPPPPAAVVAASSPATAAPTQASAAPQPQATPSPAAYATPAASGASVADILKNAGYKLLQNVTVGSQKIDYIGISATKLLVCLVDAESGDWLADEERFNDEEPLWFSESNHRVSPVRLTLNAKDALSQKLTGRTRDLKVEPMVVISQGTIINAEDMFEVWNNLHIAVCRFGSGAPNEIKTLAETITPVTGADETLYTEAASLLR